MLAQTASSAAEFGASTILTGVALIFGVVAVMKGLARLICLFCALTLAAASGYFTYTRADVILATANIEPVSWMPPTIAVVAGIGSVFAVRSLFRTFFFKPNNPRENSGIGFGLQAGLIGLSFGVIFVTGSMIGLRYADSLAQLKHLKKTATNDKVSAEVPPFVTRLRNYLDNSRAGRWLQKNDPLNDPDQLKVAKLLVLESLKKSVHNPISTLLPESAKLLPLINAEDYSSLLFRNDTITSFLENDNSREHIRQISIQSIIDDPGY